MRERITISIQKELLDKLDRQIDGSKIRNRSHAIEHFLGGVIGANIVDQGVILAGGRQALKLIPVIESSIKQLVSLGLTEVYLAVGFLGPKLKEYFGDGTKFGIKLIYLEAGEGTAGAIRPLAKIFKKTFFVFNLTEKIQLKTSSFIDFHRQHNSVATVATKDLNNPLGIYLFEPEIFQYLPDGFSMLETDVFPKLFSENKVLFYPLIG